MFNRSNKREEEGARHERERERERVLETRVVDLIEAASGHMG